MNMHNNKLVACVKSNGKVLREQNETVKLPFGTEYSIYLKNLNTLRASVKLEIDGKDVLDGMSLIINPYSEIDFERFIKNGNLEKGNRFKFIERNSKVEAARGIGAEDGLVRIEFQFERDWAKENQQYLNTYQTQYWNCNNTYTKSFYSNDAPPPVAGAAGAAASTPIGSDTIRSCGMRKNSMKSYSSNTMYSAGVASAPVNDAGITAPGSVSNQTFTTVAPLSLQSETYVIVLKLLGETETGKKIEKPVTVKSKNKCIVCNRVNKASAKFCGDCGAGLEIVK